MATLIVALDLPEKDAALALAEKLRRVDGWTLWCKVGLELFTVCGPALLESLNKLGYKIFLDLKFYDIPHTVAGAVRAAAVYADMLTLHCQGGERMCRAARRMLETLAHEESLRIKTAEMLESSGRPDASPLLFGVTALTSFAAGEMPGVALTPSAFAVYLAAKARAWGLDGVVCAGTEVKRIKAASPGLACLCPGIRPQGFAADDQRRVMTPREAVQAGADFLVIGRPILSASDPVGALSGILQEICS
ncbi:MAG: orotidine-5'-phosphate decarboxylase [Desulfovibrio sp.]|jgi:orotidine-5'-phosphate decarboxylase|nr:orotidine-5'-phosphate decarboxylase [Desulfovibrio sp.]